MLLLDDSEIFDASDAELNEASAELQTHLVSSTGAAHRRCAALSGARFIDKRLACFVRWPPALCAQAAASPALSPFSIDSVTGLLTSFRAGSRARTRS